MHIMDRQFLTTMDLQSKVKYALSGGIIGFIAWGHSPVFTAVSILFFFLYFQSKSRGEFFAAALGYYLAASRGLLTGTITYYDDKVLYGIGIWIGAALILSTAWVIFWSNSPRAKPLFFLLASLLVILPPFGLVGWTNPLLAAGLIFPGWGFYGILALIGIILWIEKFAERWTIAIPAVILIMLINFQESHFHDFKPITGITDNKLTTVNTEFGELYNDKKPDFIADFKRQNDYLGKAYNSKNKFVLMPENAVGRWTELNMMAWADLSPDKTVLTGASIQDPKHPELYDNVLLKIKNTGYEILYRQRMPVLISMWRPWEDTGTSAYLFKQKPVVEIEGVGRAGVLICYEQLLYYTLMETMAYKPERIIAISNLWWAKGTSIKEIEIASLELTSSLFNVPLSLSMNE